MAKGETVIQLHGAGPWEIKYVNPADDPRHGTKSGEAKKHQKQYSVSPNQSQNSPSTLDGAMVNNFCN